MQKSNPSAPGQVVITVASGMPTAFKTVLVNDANILQLPNYLITTLPNSGGIGTLEFTIGGLLLVGMAGLLALYPWKKRKDQE